MTLEPSATPRAIWTGAIRVCPAAREAAEQDPLTAHGFQAQARRQGGEGVDRHAYELLAQPAFFVSTSNRAAERELAVARPAVEKT